MDNPHTTYALIDCNNFFVSCERLFRPDLEGRPVVVLSSNDGCAVSRSQEAKDLGVPMGAPLFKWRDLFTKHGVVAFSANFELYGDISDRIVSLLTSVTPNIEVYSVDESFLDLTQLQIPNYAQWGKEVRASILKNIGVPVSVGIAPSKTLCKTANHYAKKHTETGGVTLLTPTATPATVVATIAPRDDYTGAVESPELLCDSVLARTPVEDIWGIGWCLAPRLKAEGIHTALDLRHMHPKYAQQLMGIRGRQMVYELNGTSCLPLQYSHKPQQMIMRGRQFGEDTREFFVIEAAIASLTARAAHHLRREGLLARRATVILRTNRLKPGYEQVTKTIRLYTPTADTGALCSQLVSELERTYNDALDYHKADILLHDLIPTTGLQTDLIGAVDIPKSEREQRRMETLDIINRKHGKRTIHYAAEHLSDRWQPRKRMSSPRYTSSWDDIPEVTIKGSY